jgi:hypothetical protein
MRFLIDCATEQQAVDEMAIKTKQNKHTCDFFSSVGSLFKLGQRDGVTQYGPGPVGSYSPDVDGPRPEQAIDDFRIGVHQRPENLIV